jgi:glycosyltransferase involved in cell wall biosynthesis
MLVCGKVILLLNDNVAVVIPALNEPYLPKLLNHLQSYHIHIQGEKGLSYAVWKGIQNCKGNVVVVMDADGSHPPEAIGKMCNLLNEDVWFIVGSRYVKNGYSYDSFLRKAISLIYCLIARVVLRTSIHDSMSGFWCGYKDKFIFEPQNTYKFGIQLIRKYKQHIREYPIIFKKRVEGKSHVKPMQALKDFYAIFYISKRKNKTRLCQK